MPHPLTRAARQQLAKANRGTNCRDALNRRVSFDGFRLDLLAAVAARDARAAERLPAHAVQHLSVEDATASAHEWYMREQAALNWRAEEIADVSDEPTYGTFFNGTFVYARDIHSV